ncbi:hypothetical protein EC991_005439 [Linnemannia zychae]|nr:hypothetical protein EC991_005439 [Linnemannia zychae]
MSRNIAQLPRIPAGVNDSLSPGVTSYEAPSSAPLSAPQFRTLQEALKVVCLNHTRGKVSESDLPRIYSQDSSVTTSCLFYTITGVNFLDEGKGLGPQPVVFVVEKGTLDYVPISESESIDSHTSPSDPRVGNSYLVHALADSKTFYRVQPRDLPSFEPCPKSCRGLFERAVRSVHAKENVESLDDELLPSPSSSLSRPISSFSPRQHPVPYSPLPDPASRTRLDAFELSKPVDESTTTVICRVGRFKKLALGAYQLYEYVVVEFGLSDGDWVEDENHYTIPVTVDDQTIATHQSYKCFGLRDKILSCCWVKGWPDDVPPACPFSSYHAIRFKDPELAHGWYYGFDATSPPSSSLPSNNKRSRSAELQQSMDYHTQQETPRSPKSHRVLLKSVALSTPSPPADSSERRPFCSICKKFFKRTKSLNQHVKDLHGMKFRIDCDMCNESFTRLKSLERHNESKHSFIKFPCVYCGKELSRADVLLDHQNNSCKKKPK